jgi:type VI secretion system secreted protein VgrG
MSARGGLEIEVGTGEDLAVADFEVTEGISRPFSALVTARSRNPSAELEALLGHRALFKATGPDGVAREWLGYCRLAEQIHAVGPTRTTAGELSTYRFEIVPSISLMKERRDFRVFRHAGAPDVAASALDRWFIEHEAELESDAYPNLPYKVQYGESDFDFFHRILEEAGISYLIRDAKTEHGLILLSDHLEKRAARVPIPFHDAPDKRPDQPYATDVHVGDGLRPGSYALRDYDLRRPALSLVAQVSEPGVEALLEHHVYRPGSFLADTGKPERTPVADERGATRSDQKQGQRLADASLGAEREDKRVVTFRTNVLSLRPGDVVTISEHPHPDLATRRLLVTSLEFEGAPDREWCLRVRAVFADVPYRPQRRTARPRARAQSAVVVGPQGNEIDADEFGRVRVRFLWDRDESSLSLGSAWVRVNQMWAGAGYGAIHLPRIGTEVVVDFLEGDPEQPVVVGRFFDQTNLVPYPLPRDATKSGWRSNSAPGVGFNELLLEDKAGEELLYHQAEKDRRCLVKHDDVQTSFSRQKDVEINEIEETRGDRSQTTTGHRAEWTRVSSIQAVGQGGLGDKKELVIEQAVERIESEQRILVGGDEHLSVGGIERELVKVDAHLAIEGERHERIQGTDSLTVGGALSESFGSYAVSATGPKGWIHLHAGGEMVIESGAEVALKAGGSFVHVHGGGVHIQGTQVKINEGGGPGDLPYAGPELPEEPNDAVVDDPGEPKIEVEVEVDIRGEGGFGEPCPRIPKGKTHRYTALGVPHGGKYEWSLSGKVTAAGSTSEPGIEVKGDDVSSAAGDSALRVKYTVAGRTAEAALVLSVFEVSKVVAKLKKTPKRRDGSHEEEVSFESTKKVGQFDETGEDDNSMTVIRGSGPLRIEAASSPEGLPMSFRVERDLEDSGELVGLPTMTTGVGGDQTLLHTDAIGSFHLFASVDCIIGAGQEVGGVLDVTVVDVQVLGPAPGLEHAVFATSHFTPSVSEAYIEVSSGADEPTKPEDSAWGIVVSMRLRGGGPKLERGLGLLSVGFNQVGTATTQVGVYSDGSRIRQVVVDGDPLKPETAGEISYRPAILPGDLTPLRGFPIKDCDRGNTADFGTGAYADRGKIPQEIPRPSDMPETGRYRKLDTFDSPNAVYPLAHYARPEAKLERITGVESFATYLCAFSRRFPATYVVLAECRWSMTWSVERDAKANGGYSAEKSRMNAPKVMTVFDPPLPAEETDFERFPPVYLEAVAEDAREAPPPTPES